MTTLINNELFEYLDNLEKEIRKKVPDENNENGDLSSLMHSQMADVISAEKRFLKYVNSNGTQPVLSISPNGLPSVQSLNPDLEKICELADEEIPLAEIAQRFKKGIKGKNNNNEERQLYVPVSEEEWKIELKNYKPEQLITQVGFAINEAEDGKFELALREDLFLKGYDQYSKEFPVLIREGKTQYHVVWNRLIEGNEESFYVPNTALVLKGKPTKPSTKVFDDIKRFYQFRKKDYKDFKGKMPWIFWGSWVPNNYSQFLSAGTNARVTITTNILETLGKALGKQVSLKGIRKNDLEAILAFSSVPFKNVPQTTPKEEDFYELSKSGRVVSSRFPTEFDLVYTSGAEKIGTIEYFLPRNAIHFSLDAYCGRCRNGYRFTLGEVELHILGSEISDESQFKKLRDGLKRVRKRR